jgi:transketolase
MATRDSILKDLIPYFNDPRYYLLVLDMGFGKLDDLKDKYPNRVYNLGIAEQGSVGIASGMAEVGLIPIVYSIATFLVYRALEQIKNDIVFRGMNVKLIGNGSGDFFKTMGDCHWCRDNDKKLMDIIGMPVYEGNQFDEWINSSEAGYIRV